MFPLLLIVVGVAVILSRRAASSEQGGAVAQAKPALTPIDLPVFDVPPVLGAPGSTQGRPPEWGAGTEQPTGSPGAGPRAGEETTSVIDVTNDATRERAEVYLTTQDRAAESLDRSIIDERVTHLGGDLVL